MGHSYSYLPGIDGLRAIAVLAVMLFHLDAGLLPGGFSGVDVFFVISGYVVARSLTGRTEESFGRFILGFYSRRIRRIVPALLLCLVLTTLFTVWFIPDSWLSSTTRQVGLFAFFGLSNLALVFYQDDYFSPRAEYNPFVHTWSLGVEEQFYFIFPLLIFIWFRFHRRPGKNRFAPLVSGLIPLLALASLYAAYALGQSRPDWAYYTLPTRFWELAAGVMLAQLQFSKRLPSLAGLPAFICLLLGLTLIGTGYWLADARHFPYPWALLPVAGTLLALWAVSGERSESTPGVSALNIGALRYCGKISYSLYLWHWPVYTLLRWTLGLDTLAGMALALTLTFALAALSYHWIETPVRNAPLLARPAYRAVVLGGLAIALFWTGAGQLFKYRADLSLSQTADTRMWYPYAYPDSQPDAQRSNTLRGYQVFVIGNSHTGAYSTLMSLLEQRQGAKAHLLQTGHCAIGNLLYPITELQGCDNTATHYLNVLRTQARPGDTVFLASLRTHRLSDQWFRTAPNQVLAFSQSAESARKLAAAYRETAAFVVELEKLGLNVLIDAPKPVLQGPPYRCSDWFNRANPVCRGGLDTERTFMEALRAPVMQSMETLAAEFSHVHLWDPLPQLCSDDLCPAFDAAHQPLFFDGDHLSGHGNRVLYPSFEQRVLSLYEACTQCSAEAREALALQTLPPLQPSQRLTFGADTAGVRYLLTGWSYPENWGVWSDGTLAELILPLDSHQVTSVQLEAHPLLGGTLEAQHIGIWLNNIKAGTARLNADSDRQFVVDIPASVRRSLADNPVLKLRLELPNATRPADLGINGDARQLGIGLTALTLR
jgi:peptidoglycan/LPS O-acetylase OafA/YrhL